MEVNRVICDVVHKGPLLLDGERLANTSALPGSLSDLFHHAVRGVLTDDLISDRQLEGRMQESMDRIQRTQRYPGIIEQIQIELKHI